MQQSLNPHEGYITTVTGNRINLRDPLPNSISITDITHALSHIPRFGAHTWQFYSVAQHSLLVASLAPEAIKLEALLHDASEAYLGDVIKPLKILIGREYQVLEDTFMLAIIRRFNLNPEYLDLVKPYDLAALEIEHQFLQKSNMLPWLESGTALPPPIYHPFDHYQTLFRKTFTELYNKRNPNKLPITNAN